MLNSEHIQEISANVGTPAYIYDASIITQRALELADVFTGSLVHFSLKSNPNPVICRLMSNLGFGAEVSSSYEMSIALNSGVLPNRIMYGGPAKVSSQLRAASDAGIKHFNLDSESELTRLQIVTRTQALDTPILCVRVNPNYASTAADEVMTGIPSRFGVDENNLDHVLALGSQIGLPINGIHLYVGSQILDPKTVVDNYNRGLNIMGQLCDKGLLGQAEPTFVFGPGLGISYTENDSPVDLSIIKSAIIEGAEIFRRQHGKLTVKIEIGRALIGQSALYVTSVIDVKRSRGTRYIIVDGGIHHFMRYALTKTAHQSFVVGREDDERSTAVICGATCTPYDVMSECQLEECQAGDLIAITNAGAYGWSMGLSNFCSRPTPPEVLIHEAKPTIIRRTSNYDDLTRLW